MTESITIYTKTGCPYCKAAMEHYRKAGKQFTEVNVTERKQEQQTVLTLTGGQSIVPVIVENGKVHIGFGGG